MYTYTLALVMVHEDHARLASSRPSLTRSLLLGLFKASSRSSIPTRRTPSSIFVFDKRSRRTTNQSPYIIIDARNFCARQIVNFRRTNSVIYLRIPDSDRITVARGRPLSKRRNSIEMISRIDREIVSLKGRSGNQGITDGGLIVEPTVLSYN